MEYRKLSKGGEMISTLGLGMGGIHKTTPDEIEAVIKKPLHRPLPLPCRPADPHPYHRGIFQIIFSDIR